MIWIDWNGKLLIEIILGKLVVKISCFGVNKIS